MPTPLFVVAAFYQFAPFPDAPEQRDRILAVSQHHDLVGTVLLATEGINGTLAGTRPNIDALLAFLRADSRLANLVVKESYTTAPPFKHLKVRLKREIITLGIPDIDPNQQMGIAVSPQDWNQLISQPEVLVIDTRNTYEVKVGTFAGAQDPQTRSFRQFPEYVRANLDPRQHRRVALFCTGGIRCEKASAFLFRQGFEEVYQLQGGILNYLKAVPSEESLWQGECFVFDERVALNHDLAVGTHSLCQACGHPVSPEAQTSSQDQPGNFCPYCGCGSV